MSDNTKKYVDLDGLKYFLEKFKEYMAQEQPTDDKEQENIGNN